MWCVKSLGGSPQVSGFGAAALYRPQVTFHFEELPCQKPSTFWDLSRRIPHQSFSSLVQSCPTLWDPWTAACQASLSITNSWSLLKLVHGVSDASQPSHPLSPPSPAISNLSQRQGPFQWISSSHQLSKVLEFHLQHQSFQWIFRTDL